MYNNNNPVATARHVPPSQGSLGFSIFEDSIAGTQEPEEEEEEQKEVHSLKRKGLSGAMCTCRMIFVIMYGIDNCKIYYIASRKSCTYISLVPITCLIFLSIFFIALESGPVSKPYTGV